MTIIGLKELRQNATDIVERAQKGEKFTVVKRSKPVLTITAAQPEIDIEEARNWVRSYVKDHHQAFSELAEK
jgi:prevent-host-death family protein